MIHPDDSPSDSCSPNDHEAFHRVVSLPGLDRLDDLECHVEELRSKINSLKWIPQQSNYQIALLFKKLHNDAKLPSKSGELEACYDISCVSDDEFYQSSSEETVFILKPLCSHIFHTGLSCAIPDGYALFLWDRSGLAAKHGIHRLAGVIDCTYRGEILVVLTNLSHKEYYVGSGDRIIQAHLTKVLPSRAVWADELPDSYRQGDGFGSTGK